MAKDAIEPDEGTKPDFSAWEPVIEAAVSVASKYNQPYRQAILTALLWHAGGGRVSVPSRPAMGEESTPRAAGRVATPSPVPPPGLEAAAEAADVDPDAVHRLIEVHDDGTLDILARIDVPTMAEAQNRYGAAYCFLKEKGFNEFTVDIEELRRVCEYHGVYNAPNFTRNFRKANLLLEIGQRGSPDKRYRLSPKGERVAKEVLQKMVGA